MAIIFSSLDSMGKDLNKFLDTAAISALFLLLLRSSFWFRLPIIANRRYRYPAWIFLALASCLESLYRCSTGILLLVLKISSRPFFLALFRVRQTENTATSSSSFHCYPALPPRCSELFFHVLLYFMGFPGNER